MTPSLDTRRPDIPLEPRDVSRLPYLPNWASKHHQVLDAYRRVYGQFMQQTDRGNGNGSIARHLLNLEQRIRNMGRLPAARRNGDRMQHSSPVPPQNGHVRLPYASAEPTPKLRGGLSSSNSELTFSSETIWAAQEREREALADLLADFLLRIQKPFDVIEDLWEDHDYHTTVFLKPRIPRAIQVMEELWDNEQR